MCQRFRDAQTRVDVFLMPVGVKAVRHGGTRMTWSWKVIPLRLRCFLHLPDTLNFFLLLSCYWTRLPWESRLGLALLPIARMILDERQWGIGGLTVAESHIDCTGMEPRPPVESNELRFEAMSRARQAFFGEKFVTVPVCRP
jgi:hypothetical protein